MQLKIAVYSLAIFLTACLGDTGSDGVRMHFKDRESQRIVVHEWELKKGNYYTAQAIPLEAYSTYDVLIEKDKPINAENDCYVIFENFDVAINFARMDRDTKGGPIGIKSMIQTFAPGTGSFHIVVKEEINKASPYNTGKTIADLNTNVTIQ